MTHAPAVTTLADARRPSVVLASASAVDPAVDPVVETATSTPAPFTLDDIDEEIQKDLAAVGVVLGQEENIDQAKREAVASLFLRLASECDDEIDRLKAAMEAQVALTRAHYERLMFGPASRRAEFIRHVEHLAMISAIAGGFGKKKSARTPFGTFGVEDRKATVQLIDPAALVAHLAEHDPDHVRVVAKIPLSQAREYLSASELEAAKMEPLWKEVKASLDPTGALLPGVEVVPAQRTAFAAPEVPAHAFAPTVATSTKSVIQ